GVTGMTQIVVNDSWIANFDTDSPVRIATEELDRRHGILTDLDLVIDSGAAEGMLEPGAIERVRALEEKLRTLPYVTGVHSITGIFREMTKASAGPGDAATGVPESRDMAAQTLLVADSNTVRR